MAEKICENFQVIMGGDQVLYDIKKAVESVGNRDYPQLNSEKIPPIFVPQLFLPKFPEAIDYKIYIQKLQKMKDTIDMKTAKELKKAQKTNKLTEKETHCRQGQTIKL